MHMLKRIRDKLDPEVKEGVLTRVWLSYHWIQNLEPKGKKGI